MPEEANEAVNNEVAQEATTSAPATDATEKSEDSQPEFQTILSESGEIQQVEVDPSENDEDTYAEKPKRGAEARKAQLSEEQEAESAKIREMVAERNQLKEESQRLARELEDLQRQSKLSEIPTVEEVMQMENPVSQDYYTRFEAEALVNNIMLSQKLAALEEQVENEKRSSQVSASVGGMMSDVQKVLTDFPVFDEESPEFNPELAKQATEQAYNSLVFDENDNPIDARQSIYKTYKAFYDTYMLSNKDASARKQARDIQTAGSADFRGSGKKIDKEFKDLSLSEMRDRLRAKGQIQ